MWKDSIELKVIRLEGFPCSSTELALYVYFGDVLHDQLLPITEEKSVLLSQEGTYRLEIINQNNQEEKSVSFNRSIFKEDGVKWIPLYSPDNDFIESIPEDVSHPRILLIFYKKRMLNIKNTELSIEETEEKKEITEPFEEEEEIVEVKSIHDEKVADYRNAVEFERKLRDEQEKNMKKLTSDLHENLERSRVREDSLLALVTEKEEELMAAQNEIASLRAKLRKLEIEKKQMTDLIESLKSEKSCQNIEGLRKELEMFTQYFSDCKHLVNIKNKLNAFEAKESSLKERENSIENFFKGKRLDLKKDSEQVYSINNKKFSLLFKDGTVWFRSLGPLQKFDDFFSQRHERSLTPSNKSHRKNLSDIRLQESDSREVFRRGNTPLHLRKGK